MVAPSAGGGDDKGCPIIDSPHSRHVRERDAPASAGASGHSWL